MALFNYMKYDSLLWKVDSKCTVVSNIEAKAWKKVEQKSGTLMTAVLSATGPLDSRYDTYDIVFIASTQTILRSFKMIFY
jgi:hypothetical protein